MNAAKIAAGIVLLAGCGGLQTAGGGFAALPQVPPPRHQLAFGNSWMDAGAASHDLLYVTNENGVVNVYRYWQHTLEGVLTDFKDPQGECADAAGNVYIADNGANKLFEYAHGGKSPIRTIDVSPNSPFGCAVNIKNGDLAVANFNYDNSTRGNIEIFRHAKGKPVVYSDRYLLGFQSLAYDGRGDLLATNGTGYDSSYYGAQFVYLPKNGIKLIAIEFCPSTSCGYYGAVQGIQWDGKYWVFANYSYLLRWTIVNNQSQFVDEILLNGAYEEGIGPFWLYRKNLKGPATQIVASSDFESRQAVFYWKYPGGGNPVGSLTKDLAVPFSVVGSLKP
ncbi:MAG: hypothetical protein WBW87_02080 [Candidatus Cybelea sp.]